MGNFGPNGKKAIARWSKSFAPILSVLSDFWVLNPSFRSLLCTCERILIRGVSEDALTQFLGHTSMV